MSPNTPRAELASAIRRVNIAYARLTADQQERVQIATDVDVDAALVTGDRDRAIAAVRDWEARQLRAIEEAAR